MNPELPIEEAVDKAIELFVADGNTLSRPLEPPNHYPRHYFAYTIGVAVIDAMQRLNLDRSNKLLKQIIEEAAKASVEGWQLIDEARGITALTLNNYSKDGPFNPN